MRYGFHQNEIDLHKVLIYLTVRHELFFFFFMQFALKFYVEFMITTKTSKSSSDHNTEVQ